MHFQWRCRLLLGLYRHVGIVLQLKVSQKFKIHVIPACRNKRGNTVLGHSRFAGENKTSVDHWSILYSRCPSQIIFSIKKFLGFPGPPVWPSFGIKQIFFYRITSLYPACRYIRIVTACRYTRFIPACRFTEPTS